jgi:D-serine deaminase-like pyridoxal phosphate-dependent protein
MKRKWIVGAFLGGCLGLMLGAWALYEKNKALLPLDPAVSDLARSITDVSPHSSFAVLDLDAVERNLRRLETEYQSRYQLRWVAKSLPSLPLLKWLAQKSQVSKFMVFQKSMTLSLLQAIPEVDLLLGKPLPVQAAEEILKQSPHASRQVHWLIDSEERLQEYTELAVRMRLPLSLILEVDVGMRRGGFEKPEELKRLAAKRSQAPITIDGLMGYDGHIPYASPIFGPGLKRAQEREFLAVQERYQAFVEVLHATFPAPKSGFILNGAGSRTFWRYQSKDIKTPINEIAVGSILVKPVHFDAAEVDSYEPALHLAIPVLKEVTQPFPYVGNLGVLWDLVMKLNPQLQRGYYLYGGAWSGQIVYPAGLEFPWFHSSAIQNLLPNQQLLMGSKDVKFPGGKRVLIRPVEGDLLSAFDQIRVLRKAGPSEWWAPMGRND